MIRSDAQDEARQIFVLAHAAADCTADGVPAYRLAVGDTAAADRAYDRFVVPLCIVQLSLDRGELTDGGVILSVP